MQTKAITQTIQKEPFLNATKAVMLYFKLVKWTMWQSWSTKLCRALQSLLKPPPALVGFCRRAASPFNCMKTRNPSKSGILNMWQAPLKPTGLTLPFDPRVKGKILMTSGQHYITHKECADGNLISSNFTVFRQRLLALIRFKWSPEHSYNPGRVEIALNKDLDRIYRKFTEMHRALKTLGLK